MALPNDLNSIIVKLSANGYKIKNVFDIGANKGRWTALYEPKMSTANFFLFEANPKHTRPPGLAAKNKWFNVVLSNAETTEVEFYTAANNKLPGTGDSYYKEQTHIYNGCNSIKLKTITLDAIVIEQSLPQPQLIKLDTQGSELDILNGAKTVLKNTDVVVIETPLLPYNKGAPTFDDYINFFHDVGFVPVGIESIIFANGLLTHIDLVFLKENIKIKYYGDNKLFTSGFNT